MGWYWNVGLGNCTEEWRLGLKLLNRSLRPASIVTYRPMLEAKAYELLSQVLANPDELEAHLNRFVPLLIRTFEFSNYLSQLSSLSGSIVLTMAYGYQVKDLNDKIVKGAKRMVQIMGEVALPGALLVNILPFCEPSFVGV